MQYTSQVFLKNPLFRFTVATLELYKSFDFTPKSASRRYCFILGSALQRSLGERASPHAGFSKLGSLSKLWHVLVISHVLL